MNEKLKIIASAINSAGAFKVGLTEAEKIKTNPSFRALCEANSCGKYGKCYTCPPDVGEINKLIESLKEYEYAFLYQTVSPLEDSFDVDGMKKAAKNHGVVERRVIEGLKNVSFNKVLYLGAGCCKTCSRCAKEDNLPCRNPEEAISSLEAYGIDVAAFAKLCDMQYINGKNTVTYFGAVFFSI